MIYLCGSHAHSPSIVIIYVTINYAKIKICEFRKSFKHENKVTVEKKTSVQ